MSDNKPNENKDDDKKDEELETPTNLEAVHAQSVEQVENEDLKGDDSDEDEADKDAPKDDDASDKDSSDKDDDKAGDDDAGAGDDDKKDDDKAVDGVPKPSGPDSKPVPETPQDDADIVSSVQEKIPKVTLKDSDGNEIEVGSADEIPDDFEPYSYKDFAVANSKLAKREAEVDRQVAEAKTLRDNKASQERIAKIQEGWDAEIESLVKSGDLDKDETKRAKQIEGIYKVMSEAAGEGSSIGTFKQAYEIYAYRQSKADQQDRQQKNNDEKKRRGGRVLPGSGANPTPSSRQGRVIEAPPSGISLDQVHESTLSGL